MVFITDDVPVLGGQHDRADHPLFVALGGDIEDPQAGQALPVDGDEGIAEELVHAADHEHRRAVGDEIAQPVGDAFEVDLDLGLTRVLATATDDEVRLLGEGLTGVVLVDDWHIAVAPDARGEAAGVAQVAVDAHLARVEVHEVDLALALATGVGGQCRSGGLTEDRDVEVGGAGVVHAAPPWVSGASTPISGRS